MTRNLTKIAVASLILAVGLAGGWFSRSQLAERSSERERLGRALSVISDAQRELEVLSSCDCASQAYMRGRAQMASLAVAAADRLTAAGIRPKPTEPSLHPVARDLAIDLRKLGRGEVAAQLGEVMLRLSSDAV